jgi:hypothetical protein
MPRTIRFHATRRPELFGTARGGTSADPVPCRWGGDGTGAGDGPAEWTGSMIVVTPYGLNCTDED